MADNTKKLIGQNYTTPDIVAKVTGKAKYAEDYKAEGMLWTKLMLSPMPHARITRMDLSAALAMPGVKAIVTADDLPEAQGGGTLGEGVQASNQGEKILTKEPVYEGEPILAVAAVDELTAAEAIEKIVIEYEPLPFVVDPLVSLRPGGPNARLQGNTWYATPPAAAAAAAPGRAGGAPAAGAAAAAPAAPAAAAATPPAAGATPAAAAGAAAGQTAQAGREGGAGRQGGGRAGGPPAAAPPRPEIKEWKWEQADFDEAAKNGQMPMGKPAPGAEWTFGNIEDGFKQADLVLEETFVSQSTGHQPLETRSAMAYWQNGKLFLHGSTQSTVQTVGSVARWVGIPGSQVVIISEYTGGGFGSKIPGAISMAIPALLSKKANAPVMMRISREEEHYIGRARQGIHSRIKVGFRKDGRITAVDLFVVGDNGPYEAQGDFRAAGNTLSLCYQPLSMRWRGVTVLTNTPPRTSQRAPGGMQGKRADGAGRRQGRAQARY